MALGFLMGGAPVANAQVLYVDDDAPAGGNGLTWNTAYRFLQDALSDAADGGPAVTEIHVGQGTYQPDRDELNPDGPPNCFDPHGGMGCTDAVCEAAVCAELALCCAVAWDDLCVTIALDVCDTEFREATFQLVNGVALKGGYAGVGAKDPHDRDTELYETVLSGDLIGNDGPDFLDNGENSYHVVTGSGTDLSAVLDGFTVTAGHADAAGIADGLDFDQRGAGMINLTGSPTVTGCLFNANRAAGAGGGMYNRNQSSPDIIDCAFIGNLAAGPGGSSAGGGMINSTDSNPTISDCTFTGNITLADSGAGMANVFDSGPTITNCTFNNNTSGLSGGGMFNHTRSNPDVTDCTFDNNTAASHGGGMSNWNKSNPTVTDCTFDNNTAAVLGGGMYTNSSNSNWTVTNCAFTANTAGLAGGGMKNTSSNPTVENCTFTGNSAPLGGGMENYNSSPTIANCLFIDNTATEGDYGGGGMLSSTNSSTSITNCTFCGNSADLGAGGGMFTTINSMTTITNCTFTGNSAVFGGGMHTSDQGGGHSETSVDNTIAWGNTPDQISEVAGGTTTVSHSDVEGGWVGAGANNIDADPLFVEPADCDDLHLLPGSPCIDAGSNTAVPEAITTDLDGNPRFLDDPCKADAGLGDPPIVDMGAYEFQGCSCDLNSDGSVGVNDFLLLLAAWGPCVDCNNCPADFDGDCNVGVTDFLKLLAVWGPCP
jgi:parallel beta-helix repeat protein